MIRKLGCLGFPLVYENKPTLRWLLMRIESRLYKHLVISAVVLVFTAPLSSVLAADSKTQQTFHFSIPQQRADQSLNHVATKANITLFFPYEVMTSRTVKAIEGVYTVEDAISKLLEGTDYEVSVRSNGHLSIVLAKKTSGGVEIMHKLTKVASAVMSFAAATTLAMSASAQEQNDLDSDGSVTLEEIIVLGIRESLVSAADRKRNSDQIRDSIVSEDIGRFPDSNVAESLQRIPGVAIDRNSGEGQRVTVRGFGPDFNTVLLNGRRLASSSIAGVGGGADDNIGASLSGRGFNFDIISADLIGGADVYKSASVALQEGGIGSTINLSTLRPLDMPEESTLFSAKAIYGEVGDDLSPSAFGFFNRKFLNDRLGILGSVSYQNRKQRRETLSTNGYIQETVTAGQTSGIGPGVGGVPGTYFRPQQSSLTINEQERERIGVTGTIQYQASDSVSLTFDTIYSELDVDSNVDTLANFYFINGSNLSEVQLDANNTFISFNNSDRQLAYNGRAYTRPTSLLSLGGNLEWQVNDRLTLDFDLAYSDAEDSSDEDGGGGRFAVIREAGNLRYDARTGVPALSTDAGFGSNTDSLTTFVLGRFGEGVDDELTEVKASGEYRFENSSLSSIRFGAQYSDEDRFNTVVEQADGVGFYAFPGGARVTVPGTIPNRLSTSGVLSGASGVVLPDAIVSYDIDSLLSFLGTDAAFSQRDGSLGLAPGTSAAQFAARGGFDATLSPGQSFGVSEEILALYTEFQFEGELGGRPWSMNLGVRYTETETTASGFQDTITDIRAIGPGETAYRLERTVADAVSVSSEYDNFLPSLNARIGLTDDLVLRAAYSETLTRPRLSDLAPSLSLADSELRPGNFVLTAGNPNLEPFESENFDLSLEWYYGEGSYLSGAAFKKDVSGFVVTQDFIESFTITNADNIANEPAINGNIATFTVRRPANSTEANVDGLELSWQHTFATGFGVQANATFVDSNAELNASDLNPDANSALLPGLGDSYNLVLFYENDKLGARLAYNVRDEFLRAAATGPGSEPAFVRDYEQLDFRVSYRVNDILEVFLDGTNILGEVTEQRGRFENHFLLVEDTGARYSLGFRGKF